MHIPDGFLSTPVWAALDIASLPAVGYMARSARLDVEDSRIPLLGVLGAFVFAAQMVNFPVGPGTSGHLVGGTLLACTVGPAAASLVMTAILLVQALMFQDGGVLALGANVISMGVFGVLAGYAPYHLLGRGRARRFAIFAGGVLSVLASALSAMAFLWVSGVRMPAALVGLPLLLFAVSAVLEGVITVAVIEAIERIHPGWVRRPTASGGRGLRILAAAAFFLAVAGFVFASNAPDGLERLSEHLGIASQATALVSTPLADYEAHFLESVWLRRAAAGLAGVAAAYALCLLTARLLARGRSA